MRDSKVRARVASAAVVALGLLGLMCAWTLQAGPPKPQKSAPAPAHAAVGGGGGHAAGPVSMHGAGGGGISTAHPGAISTSGGGGVSTAHPGAVSTEHAGGVSTAHPGAVSTAGGGLSPAHPGAASTAGGGASNARPGGGFPGAANTARPGGSTAAGNHPAGTAGGINRPGGAAPGATAAHAGAPAGTAAGAARPGGANFGGHAAPGGHQEFARNGSAVQRRADGKVADVHDAARGMDVHHGLDGSTHSVHELPGGGRVVAARGGGYVQRPYTFHGHEFGHRTYFAHGRAYDRFYGRWAYRGHFFDVYVRAHYYRYGFYYYAYNPWATPVVYVGPAFAVAPAYGYYYAPYAVYPGPAYYLTDEAIADSLVAAYDAQQGVGALLSPDHPRGLLALGPQLLDALFTPAYAEGGATTLNKEVKDQVAAEIQGILRQEAAEAKANAAGKEVDPTAGNILSLFSDLKPHVLLAGASADAVSGPGMECAITAGDVLSVSGIGGDSADARVLASKNGGKECPVGSTVAVAVSDLQDMYNFMRESVDDGLQDLQKKAGTGGLPPIPADAAGGLSRAAFAKAAPPPEADARNLIAAQVTEADAAEKDVTAGVSAEVANGGITPGSTIEEVVAQLGQPTRIIDLGLRKTYIYPDKRIIFVGGAVSEVSKTAQ